MVYLYHVNELAYHKVNDQIIIGRTIGDIVIEDFLLSRQHASVSAEIEGNNLHIYVEDFDSKNRTTINRLEIPPLKKMKVHFNSLLEVGSQQFIITNNPKLSIPEINAVMDKYKNVQTVKLNPEEFRIHRGTKTTSFEIPEETSNSFFYEEKIRLAKKELVHLDGQLVQDLKKLEEMKEKLIQNNNIKKEELTKKITTLELNFIEFKDKQAKIKEEIEQKKKKIISLKDLPGKDEDTPVTDLQKVSEK